MIRQRVSIKILSLAGLYVLFGIFALVSGVSAQEETETAEAEKAEAEFTASKQTAAPGETVLITIKLKLAENAHANSNSPADPLLIPTVFIPKKSENMDWGAIEYPEATEVVASYSAEPLKVFEDGAEIKVEVKIKEDFKENNLKIEGRLRIQVCDDQQCYPPKTISLSTQIEVKKK